MARYYFDILDAGAWFHDEEGQECPNMNAAIALARQTLADMIRDNLRDRDEGVLEIRIRDGDEGPIVLTLTMSMLDETPS